MKLFEAVCGASSCRLTSPAPVTAPHGMPPGKPTASIPDKDTDTPYSAERQESHTCHRRPDQASQPIARLESTRFTVGARVIPQSGG